ncbi:hypothetical protein [Acinetobacter modestus]|uniref:Uncharacterized protein n=1 Tax=Acinetobacter modestus TaxID=1776740 RepID=A0ABN0JRQ0_9GAMM|nr:hypothetical protein [Acinetobacter modestus]ENU27951.1 hypothetical protein F992_00783 [Acinetobacter modestus]GGA21348.1 hypothetical protein GCM10017554_17970 [Acinetobacter modestus]
MSNNKSINTYDAGDMADAYANGRESLQWLSTLIDQIGSEFGTLQTICNEHGVHEAKFKKLNSLLNLADFLALNRMDSFARLKEMYDEEYEEAKREREK